MCDVTDTKPGDLIRGVLGPDDLVRFDFGPGIGPIGAGAPPPPIFLDLGCRVHDGRRCIFRHVKDGWYRELTAAEIAALRRRRRKRQATERARVIAYPSLSRPEGSRAARPRARHTPAFRCHAGSSGDDGDPDPPTPTTVGGHP
jgi:hypothetical protein